MAGDRRREGQTAAIDFLLKGDEASVVQTLTTLYKSRPEVIRKVCLDVGLSGGGAGDLRELSQQRGIDGIDAPQKLADAVPTDMRRHLQTTPMDIQTPGAAKLAEPDRTSFHRLCPIKDLTIVTPGEKLVEHEHIPPVLSFATLTNVVSEAEKTLSFYVIRIGDNSKKSTVKWTTKDGSAKAGQDFVGMEGVLVFEPHEHEKMFNVELLEDSKWEVTLEFFVELIKDSVDGATLSGQASKARCKIMDNDTFPSNKFHDQILNGDLELIPKWPLLWDYIKFNFGNLAVRKRTWFNTRLDLLEETIRFLQMIVFVMLVNWILESGLAHPDPNNPGEEIPARNKMPMLMGEMGDVMIPLMLVCAAEILPFIVLMVNNQRRILAQGMGGPSRAILLSGIFRKYLEVDHGHRMRLKLSDLRSAMTRDAISMVGEGYISAIKMIREVYRIIFCILFQFAVPLVRWVPAHGTELDSKGPQFPIMSLLYVLACMVLYPLLMIAWIRCRSTVTAQALKNHHTAFKGMNSLVEGTASNFRLIADYNKRPLYADEFDGKVKVFNKKWVEKDAVFKTNLNFAQAIGLIMTCGWIILGGLLTTTGGLSKGFFLANMQVFGQVSGSYDNIYKLSLDMEMCLPCVVRCVRFMNLPSELVKRKVMSEMVQAQTHAYREHAFEAVERNPSLDMETKNVPFMDRLPIVLGNLPFTYVVKLDSGKVEELTKLAFRGCFEVFQGQLVCLTGTKGVGKSTCLKILGGEIFLNQTTFATLSVGTKDTCMKQGRFYIPSHLRVTHVGQPMFVEGTLLKNLRFGVAAGSKDGDLKRVERIVRRLGVAKEILDILHAEEAAEADQSKKVDPHPWDTVLSPTQCQLLHLARALVANPAVIIVHKPTSVFGDPSTKLTEELKRKTPDITATLREFVKGRGLEQDPKGISSRRPRTCIMSSPGSVDDVDDADQVYLIHEDGRIEQHKAFYGQRMGMLNMAQQWGGGGGGGGLPAGDPVTGKTAPRDKLIVSIDGFQVTV